MTVRAAVLLAFLLTLPASAQTAVKSFDLERLVLTPGARQSLVLGTGDTLNKGGLRLSLGLQYQHNPLLYYVEGERFGAVIARRVSTHIGLGYGITDALEVGLQLPIVVHQSGDDLTEQGIVPVTSSVLGAPFVQAQYAIFQQARNRPVDMTVSAGFTFPLGGESGLARDPGSGISFIPRIGVGHAFGSLFRLGGEVGAVIRESDVLSRYTQQTTDEIGSLITLGAVANTLGDGLRGELSVRGSIPLTRTSGAVEILLGGRYPFARNTFEAFALIGPGFGRMPGTPAFRAVAGIAWIPNLGSHCVEGQVYSLSECPDLDRDHDNVPNGNDACPEQAGPASSDGCAAPEAPAAPAESPAASEQPPAESPAAPTPSPVQPPAESPAAPTPPATDATPTP